MFFFSIFDFIKVAKKHLLKRHISHLGKSFLNRKNMTFPKVSHNNSQNFKSSPPKKYESLIRFKLKNKLRLSWRVQNEDKCDF
jgi:hypothetical protein